MNPQGAGEKLQEILAGVQNFLKPVDTRWVVFLTMATVILIAKAVTLHGLADLLALLYIMYWVTFK